MTQSSTQLNGLAVLITRPRNQSDNLAALINEKGGEPFIFPTLEIVPVDPVGGWEALSQKIKDTDLVIFTSANAVRQVFSHNIFDAFHREFAAIGTATKAAMAEYNLRCDWVPMKDYRSEGLLDLPVFKSIKDKKIIILSGEGGRDYLHDTLKERGARVEKIAVYRRICATPDRAILEKFLALEQPKVIISTSVESLSNLLALSAEVCEILSIPLVVVSDRVAITAKEKNFKKVYVAENASDEAIAMSLERVGYEHAGSSFPV